VVVIQSSKHADSRRLHQTSCLKERVPDSPYQAGLADVGHDLFPRRPLNWPVIYSVGRHSELQWALSVTLVSYRGLSWVGSDLSHRQMRPGPRTIGLNTVDKSLQGEVSRNPHLAPPPTFRRLIPTYNPENHQIPTTYITTTTTLRNIAK
jgi:hypothetical protein